MTRLFNIMSTATTVLQNTLEYIKQYLEDKIASYKMVIGYYQTYVKQYHVYIMAIESTWFHNDIGDIIVFHNNTGHFGFQLFKCLDANYLERVIETCNEAETYFEQKGI